MKILVIGNQLNFNELISKFGDDHDYKLSRKHDLITPDTFDVVFDFLLEKVPDKFGLIKRIETPVIFFQSLRKSLMEMVHPAEHKVFAGFNGLPTLLYRPLLEISLLHPNDESEISKICAQLGTEYQLVEDRVGMVTPRVILMIINEAFYTYQEGTASPQDIDLAMKLGTNYPFGPFEWCEKIGIKNVYEILDALYQDTREERYKISSLLKKTYLKAIKDTATQP